MLYTDLHEDTRERLAADLAHFSRVSLFSNDQDAEDFWGTLLGLPCDIQIPEDRMSTIKRNIVNAQVIYSKLAGFYQELVRLEVINNELDDFPAGTTVYILTRDVRFTSVPEGVRKEIDIRAGLYGRRDLTITILGSTLGDDEPDCTCDCHKAGLDHCVACGPKGG